MKRAVVTKNGARRVRGGHLWIYRSDVKKVIADGGDQVTVFDESGNFVGQAFYSDSSEITLRIFTTSDETIGDDFWRGRIRAAHARRNPVATNAFRVVNSEADLVPSLIIDNYNGVFVIQTLTQGTEKLKDVFTRIIVEEFAPIAVVERNDAKVRMRENLPLVSGVLFGEVPGVLFIEQDGIAFRIAPLDGQKTGSFLDQRENHLAVRRFAKGRALDCFTFNGGFAMNLARVCDDVLAIDISEDAIQLAKANAATNGLSNIRFETANVFDALRELEKSGEKFDTIVLDPPAFVKTKAALRSAVRGYKEINLRALKLLNDDGILVTCSCSFHFSEAIFLETLESAARDAKRRIHLLEKRTQSSDHPILLGVPETYYLKCLVLRVLQQ
ncbi:MAG: class I SAM-dependent rRNA methyltransferase [Acidobacteria bacterium]|nr:class I SAM-dependent rRNA methyltransferase [Acidobacteriota bacterium]